MIKILLSSTHGKISYAKATKAETVAFEKLVANALNVYDMDKKKFESFYIQEKNFFPTHLLHLIKPLTEGFEVEYVDYRKKIKILPASQVKFPNPKMIPRDYQFNAFVSVEKNPHGGIIQLPTGTGKSIIIAGLAQQLQCKKLFIIPGISLIWQQKEFFNKDCGISDKRIAMFQGVNEKYDGDEDIILLSPQSYLKMAHIFPEIGAIIYDEAHYCNDTIEKIILSCQNATCHIGLTATAQDHLNEYENVKVQSFFGEVICDESLREMIDQDVLVKVEVHVHNIESQPELPVMNSWNDVYEYEELEYEKYVELKKAGENVEYKDQKYYLKTLVELGNETIAITDNEFRNKLICDIALKSKRVLILVSKIRHGKKLLEILGDKAIFVSGSDLLADRKKAQNWLDEDENSIVIATKIFNTGVNIEGIETIIIADGGVSAILTKQKIGRGTRKSKRFFKYQATTHDFFDSHHPVTKRQSRTRYLHYKKLDIPIKNFYH